MYIPQVGDRITVIDTSGTRGYEKGAVYTVIAVDDDQTLKAENDRGSGGNWINFSQVAPSRELNYDWLIQDWPADILRLLAAFDGFKHRPIRAEIKDCLIRDLDPSEIQDGILRYGDTEAP